MEKRTKILTVLFGVLVGSAVLVKGAFPRWIQPLLQIDARLEEHRTELAELERWEARVLQAKYRYRDYASRVGSMDPVNVQNRVKERLDELVERNQLENASVSPPRRINTDRKTDLSRMMFSVTAEGKLEATVKFLRDVAELPYLLRLDNPKLQPASESRRDRDKDRIRLDTSIELLVLPQYEPLKVELADAQLVQPASFVRHLDRDYSEIWKAKPFLEYQKPPPVRPRREPEVKVEKPEPRPEPVEPVRSKRWPNRDRLQVVMPLRTSYGNGQSRQEVMLYDTREKETIVVPTGEDFDGGSLLYVHQSGVLVGREDGDFVYPIGEPLSRPIPLADASGFPELQAAWQRIQRETPAVDEPDRRGGEFEGQGGKRTPSSEAGAERSPADVGEQTPLTVAGEQTASAEADGQGPLGKGGDEARPAKVYGQKPPAEAGEQATPTKTGADRKPAEKKKSADAEGKDEEQKKAAGAEEEDEEQQKEKAKEKSEAPD
jgi:Tfp pilus assembly protein PilO